MIISNTKLWFIDRTFEITLVFAFAYIFRHLFHIDGDLLVLLAMSVGMLTAIVIYKQVEKTKLWAKYRPTQK